MADLERLKHYAAAGDEEAERDLVTALLRAGQEDEARLVVWRDVQKEGPDAAPPNARHKEQRIFGWFETFFNGPDVDGAPLIWRGISIPTNWASRAPLYAADRAMLSLNRLLPEDTYYRELCCQAARLIRARDTGYERGLTGRLLKYYAPRTPSARPFVPPSTAGSIARRLVEFCQAPEASWVLETRGVARTAYARDPIAFIDGVPDDVYEAVMVLGYILAPLSEIANAPKEELNGP